MLSRRHLFLASSIFIAALGSANAYTINTSVTTSIPGGWTLPLTSDLTITGSGELFLEQFSGVTKTSVQVHTGLWAGGVFYSGDTHNGGLIAFSDAFLDGTTSHADFTTNNFYNYSTGVIDLTRDNPYGKSNSPVGDTITVTGNYVAQGGTIKLNTFFDDATSNNGVGLSDKLIIGGTATTGGMADTPSQLVIVPAYHSGYIGATQGNGIEVINVGAAAPIGSNDNAFVLQRPLTVGAFEYGLGKGLTAATANNWYLRTIAINPTVGAYLGAQTAATQMFSHSLTNRQSAIALSHDTNIWIRTQGSRSHYKSVHKLINNQTRTYTVQLGTDFLTLHNGLSSTHIGIMAGYGDYENNTKSQTGSRLKAKAETTGYNVGLYATWFADSESQTGAYIDMWSQMAWFKNEVTAKSTQQHKKYNSHVWSNSLEFGYGLAFAKGKRYQWVVTPQAQFTYHYYDANDFRDQTTTITNHNASGLETRLGTKLQAKGLHTNRLIQPYLELNWINTTAKNQLDFNRLTLKDGLPKNRGEAKIGLEGNVTDRFNVSAAVGGQWGKNDFSQYRAEINVGYKW